MDYMEDVARTALDALIRERGEDYASLSRLIGRNPAYIQQYIKRGTPLRLAEADRRRLADYFRVPEERLGGPPQPKPVVAVAAGSGKGMRGADLVLVPRIDVGASAGPGGLVDAEERAPRLAFDARLLRELAPGGADELSMIRVAGDSMESTLVDGDDILVDRGDAAARLREGIYVLRIDDALIVKRIERTGACFVVRSDNPTYRERWNYDPDQVRVIGRVIWAGRRLR
jgi:hypothetical protein